MRVRTKCSTPTVYQGTGQWKHYCSEAGDDPLQTYESVCTPSYEQITDWPGSSRTRCGTVVRASMKNVDHFRWRCDISTDALNLVYYRTGTIPGLPNCQSVACYTNSANLTSILTGFTDLSSIAEYFPLNHCDGGSSHYDRWLKAKPSMATRANMTVFLGELRDIKRMFDIMPQKHFSLRNWREVIRYGNSQHLNWNFGWAPFLKDIAKCWEGLSTFEMRLAKFLREQNQQLIKHVADPAIEEIGDSGWINTWNEGYTTRRTWAKRTVNRSTFQFSYSVPPFSFEGLRWRAYLDTLGLTGSIANVWALIPWSFVWDWFLRIGDHLKTYSSDWIEPWIYFCQACSTSKTVLTGDIKFAFSGWGYGIPYEWEAAKFQYSHFSRGVGCPTYVWTNPSSLNADKIRLLASLGISLII